MLINIKNESNIIKIFKNCLIKIVNRLENNNNCNFKTNGEEKFINDFFSIYRNSKMIIFDIGGNIGNYSAIILKKCKEYKIDYTIHIFEPTKSCFSILNEKFGTNNSIIINNFGLSNVNTKTLIYYDKENSGLASLYRRNLKAYNIQLDKSEMVDLKRMEDYINERKIPRIDFLKVDIEGHELFAFKGFGPYLSSKFITVIQFEYGGANLDSHTSLMEIYELLKKRGFEVFKIMPKYIEKRQYYPYMDNFFYSNYVAISKEFIIDKINPQNSCSR
jgi:FkbM family methyltransferase